MIGALFFYLKTLELTLEWENVDLKTHILTYLEGKKLILTFKNANFDKFWHILNKKTNFRPTLTFQTKILTWKPKF